MKDYQKMKFGKETYFYMLGQKTAYKKKYQHLFEDLKSINSTQEQYTFYKDLISDETTIFAVTDDAEFIKIDIETILP